MCLMIGKKSLWNQQPHAVPELALIRSRKSILTVITATLSSDASLSLWSSAVSYHDACSFSRGLTGECRRCHPCILYIFEGHAHLCSSTQSALLVLDYYLTWGKGYNFRDFCLILPTIWILFHMAGNQCKTVKKIPGTHLTATGTHLDQLKLL